MQLSDGLSVKGMNNIIIHRKNGISGFEFIVLVVIVYFAYSNYNNVYFYLYSIIALGTPYVLFSKRLFINGHELCTAYFFLSFPVVSLTRLNYHNIESFFVEESTYPTSGESVGGSAYVVVAKYSENDQNWKSLLILSSKSEAYQVVKRLNAHLSPPAATPSATPTRKPE